MAISRTASPTKQEQVPEQPEQGSNQEAYNEDDFEDDFEDSRAMMSGHYQNTNSGASPVQYHGYTFLPAQGYAAPQPFIYSSGTPSGYGDPPASGYPAATFSGYPCVGWQGPAYAGQSQCPQYLGFMYGSQFSPAPAYTAPFVAPPAASTIPQYQVIQQHHPAQQQAANAMRFGHGRVWPYIPGYNPDIHGRINDDALYPPPPPLYRQARPVLPLEPVDADLGMVEMSRINQERRRGM